MPARKGSWAGRGGDSTLLALILNPSLPLVFKHSLSLVLLPALLLGLAPRPARAAQTQSRERRATTRQASSATTPAPAQTPARPTPTPATTPAATQTPTPSATTPARQASAPQTLEELRARLREIIARPEFASSRLAVKVASLDTGRVLFEQDAGKWMQPASNMKLYTVAAALDRLTPDFRFVTSVYAPARPDTSGTVRGDLVIYGRGDPSYATRFNPAGDTDYYRAINELAANVVKAGVRRVEGDLVGDESYFSGPSLAPGWEWDDLQWWYGAEVSALTVNDNSVDLSVKPGARVGDPCVITVGPSMPFVTVVDRTTTAERGTRRDVSVHRALGQNTIEVRGTLPLDDRGLSESVAVSHPALMFTTMLRAALERQGVAFTGQTRTVDAQSRADNNQPLQVSSLVEIATRQSPPLSVIAAKTLKPSQNLYAELILRALGKAAATDPRQATADAGVEAVRKFLAKAGVDERVSMLDGSGLSRADLVTADATLQLLTYMNRHPAGAVFREALPIAGVDGTLRNHMKGTPAQGNVRAKTGTLGTANSLSGYVLSAAGERLVFSLMVNNPPRDLDAHVAFNDAVAVLLASFAGRS